MVVALYFGSFDPMHIGHLTICKYLADSIETDQVRLVVSPANPLKKKSYSASGAERLKSVSRAVSPLGRKVKVSGIEFTLKRPLYTINTLREINRREPGNKFILVIGADNLEIIEKWHDWRSLLEEFEVWVYPRKGIPARELCGKYGTRYLEAPVIDISSTQIRDSEERGYDLSHLKV